MDRKHFLNLGFAPILIVIIVTVVIGSAVGGFLIYQKQKVVPPAGPPSIQQPSVAPEPSIQIEMPPEQTKQSQPLPQTKAPPPSQPTTSTFSAKPRPTSRELILRLKENMKVFKDLSRTLCLNILIDGFTGAIYNGEYVGGNVPEYYEFGPYEGVAVPFMRKHSPVVAEADIDGDRLGYVYQISADYMIKEQRVVVDGKDYGPGLNLIFSDEHFAFKRHTSELMHIPTGPNATRGIAIFHIVFDGKDLGPKAVESPLRINGDHLIYEQYLDDGVQYLFASDIYGGDKNLGKIMQEFRTSFSGSRDVSISGDYDGKNLVLLDEAGNLIFNGKVIDSESKSARRTFGHIRVKDGHVIYTTDYRGDFRLHAHYDSKDLGPFSSDVDIEKGHLAYFSWNKAYWDNPKGAIPNIRFIYDGKDHGEADYRSEFSLAGDHFAFVERFDKQSAGINIDGKSYPLIEGNYIHNWDRDGLRVKITEKSSCTRR